MRKSFRNGSIQRFHRMSVSMTLVFLTIALVGTAALSTSVTAQPADWSDVMVRQTDAHGYDIALRKGDENLGYRHYADNHNLHSTAAIKYVLKGSLIVDQGAHREYVADFKDSKTGRVYVRVRVVVQAASQTDDRQYAVNDDYIGVITAFCEGMQRCPNSIDRLR
ncbi:hypothetical protein [Nocardia sp. N2S4-5]|uniref:hypothetical protein n=1 Tax=Nocardia sp. N2S4-5 TaxID=3351565 RepID=UPI0037D4F8C2